LTAIDAGPVASGVQSVGVEAAADASQSLAVLASGLTAAVGSTGWSGVAGQSASSADGVASIAVLPKKY